MLSAYQGLQSFLRSPGEISYADFTARTIELDIPLEVNCKEIVNRGSIECTEAYARLEQDNLFDNNSMLNKEQVKSLYLTVEKRFAENLKGEVKISKSLLVKGSVMREFVVPILEKNDNLKIIYV